MLQLRNTDRRLHSETGTKLINRTVIRSSQIKITLFVHTELNMQNNVPKQTTGSVTYPLHLHTDLRPVAYCYLFFCEVQSKIYKWTNMVRTLISVYVSVTLVKVHVLCDVKHLSTVSTEL